jgi:hypothetical protein
METNDVGMRDVQSLDVPLNWRRPAQRAGFFLSIRSVGQLFPLQRWVQSMIGRSRGWMMQLRAARPV